MNKHWEKAKTLAGMPTEHPESETAQPRIMCVVKLETGEHSFPAKYATIFKSNHQSEEDGDDNE